MKILFLSNYFNHHQEELCDGLWEETGGNFLFVETQAMPAHRAELGCAGGEREYVLFYKGNEERVHTWIHEAHAVIAGTAPEGLIRRRIRAGKLLFRYRERPLRRGLEPGKYLFRLLRWHWRDPVGKPIYLLCAGAYTAGDYAKFGLFRGKAFRWGYFPACREYEMDALFSGKDPRKILWCGRLIDLKHPELALEAARELREQGYTFHMELLGGGPMEQELKQLAAQYQLENVVSFGGIQSAGAVREAMEGAGIFLFTSDRAEGWGAVVNEAMNSGCALVAASGAGAVPYLLRHGENGLVASGEAVSELVGWLAYLLDHPQIQQSLGAEAYRTISALWNGRQAARRLVRLTEALLSGESGHGLFAEGPCAPA